MKPFKITTIYLVLFGLPLFFISCDSLSPLEPGTGQAETTQSTQLTGSSTLTLTDGLVAHWAFDDMSGTVASDGSGNGLDGTVYGATWTTGVINGALSFDGYDDVVMVPSEGETPPLEIGSLDKGTVCMWFNYREFDADTTEVAPVLYLGAASGRYSGLIVEIGHDDLDPPNRRLFFTVLDRTQVGDRQCFDSNFDLDSDTWYHFCGVVTDSSNTGYLDGLEMVDRHYNLKTSASNHEFFSTISVQEILTMGYGQYGQSTDFFYYPGIIDDIRIYDRPLEGDEIWALYQLGDADANQPPIAGFSYTTTDLAVDFTDQSSDNDGTIVSWDWDFGDGNGSVNQHPSHTYASAGTYEVTLTVIDNEDADDAFSQSITVNAGTGDGAFIEQAGLVVFEAEHFMTKTDRSGHSWVEITDLAGYSGEAAMLADPDDGTRIKNEPASTSPELSFTVDFSTTATYYIWVRAWAPDALGSFLYAGFDGSVTANSMEAGVFNEWVWTNVNRRDEVVTLTVTNAGLHDIQIWMLDDGLAVDKVVLTTNPEFTPEGEGPPESPRE